jgi:hypothetical protein
MTEEVPICGATLDVTLRTAKYTTHSLKCTRPPHHWTTEHVAPQGSTWMADPRCPARDEDSGIDRCELFRGHGGNHRIIDGRNAQGSA